MSTVVNSPAPERTVVASDSSGWAVAVIVLLLVIGGGVYYFMQQRAQTPTQQPVIQVNLPTGDSGQQPQAQQ